MKLFSTIVFACIFLAACNNTSKENTDTTVSDTTATMQDNQQADMNTTAQTADAGSADFLMKAADGGLAEVAAGQVAQSKATNESVKMFAGMMVNDHTGANQKVKDLAAKLQVTLPAAPSEEHQKKLADTEKKQGSAFDKAYMDMMVDDHKKTISLFRDGAGNAGNQEVKDFINNTLPTLQVHLDSAQAIRKRL